MSRVVCLAAHPDDETIGVGGTLRLHAEAGDEVCLIVATQAYQPRWSAEEIERKRKECERAAEVLGIAQVQFLGLSTMHLAALPTIDLTTPVAAAIQAFEPEIVYAPPAGDINSDHAALFAAVNVACRPLGSRGPRKLYSYEIATTTRFNLPGSWQANTYVDISTVIEPKMAAMAAYQTELREPPHPRSLEGIRIFARERGFSVGKDYAEALMLVREVR
jgi:LmbE family N-acetylglucosaminyl deacetylase